MIILIITFFISKNFPCWNLKLLIHYYWSRTNIISVKYIFESFIKISFIEKRKINQIKLLKSSLNYHSFSQKTCVLHNYYFSQKKHMLWLSFFTKTSVLYNYIERVQFYISNDFPFTTVSFQSYYWTTVKHSQTNRNLWWYRYKYLVKFDKFIAHMENIVLFLAIFPTCGILHVYGCVENRWV